MDESLWSNSSGSAAGFWTLVLLKTRFGPRFSYWTLSKRSGWSKTLSFKTNMVHYGMVWINAVKMA